VTTRIRESEYIGKCNSKNRSFFKYFFYYISAPAPFKSFDWKSEDYAAVLKQIKFLKAHCNELFYWHKLRSVLILSKP